MIRAPLPRKLLAAAIGGAAALMLVASAEAHHSAAMYDNTKISTVTGAVKEYHWMNPHVIVTVVGKDESGVEASWNFECSAPSILVRSGWGAHSLSPGDKIQVQMRPMKDGGKAGMMLTATTPANVVLKDHGGGAGPVLQEK